MATDEIDYEALAERLTDPSIEIRSRGPVLRGTDAATAGRAMLLESYGSEEALEAAMVRPGRPRVGARKGPSPTVRARISEEDFAAFSRLREETGRTEAELIREAVSLLLTQHEAAKLGSTATKICDEISGALSERARREIVQTFNSLTLEYSTVPEYVASEFPTTGVWGGDSCGCTDDRCIGYHHSAGVPCGCLNVQLNEYHADLGTAYHVRKWLETQPDRAAALQALDAFRQHPEEAGAGLTVEQRATIRHLVASTSHLESKDYARALDRLGLDVLNQRPTEAAVQQYPALLKSYRQ